MADRRLELSVRLRFHAETAWQSVTLERLERLSKGQGAAETSPNTSGSGLMPEPERDFYTTEKWDSSSISCISRTCPCNLRQ